MSNVNSNLVGQYVASGECSPDVTYDFGIVIAKVIRKRYHGNFYNILWQKDKMITGPYSEEEINEYIRLFGTWFNEENNEERT